MDDVIFIQHQKRDDNDVAILHDLMMERTEQNILSDGEQKVTNEMNTTGTTQMFTEAVRPRTSLLSIPIAIRFITRLRPHSPL